MPDIAAFEKEIDATVAAAQALMAEAKRLAAEAEEGRKALAQWKQSNNMNEETVNRFFAALGPEEQKRVEEDDAAFENSLEKDLDAAINAALPPGITRRKNRGNRQMA